jgi:hypothetical protein
MHPASAPIAVVQFSTSRKMFTDSMNLDVDSTDHDSEHCISSKKEESVARAQFLALCWTLFVVGWTDGSTGALLPRIQNFYDVSLINLYLFFADRLLKTSHEF